jgi:hypothetical protein
MLKSYAVETEARMSEDPKDGSGDGEVVRETDFPVDEITTNGLTETQATIAIVGTVVIGIIGVLGGLAIIGFGIYMIINGVTGSVDVAIRSGENQVDVKTVVIGVVVAIIGVAVISLTGIKINKDIKKSK